MKSNECHPMDEIFSHEDEQGVTRHFNTTAMARAVGDGMSHPERASLTLFSEIIAHIESNHGVEEEHLDAMEHRIEIPILMVEFEDGTNLVVDGNHRIVKRHRMGITFVNALIFKPGMWENFLVVDMNIPRHMYVGG